MIIDDEEYDEMEDEGDRDGDEREREPSGTGFLPRILIAEEMRWGSM